MRTRPTLTNSRPNDDGLPKLIRPLRYLLLVANGLLTGRYAWRTAMNDDVLYNYELYLRCQFLRDRPAQNVKTKRTLRNSRGQFE
jgi:hypothetical protein